MIDKLKENYNIEISKYKEYKEGIIFYYDGYYYYYTKCYIDENSLKELNKLIITLKHHHIKLHDFIYNNKNELITEEYILLRINNMISNITLDDLNKFSKINMNKYLDNYLSMDQVWEQKIDYLELQLKEISNNKLINNSFDYFSGIAEIIIKYLKINYNKNKINIVLSHQTLTSLSNIDYYNPLNISYDHYLKDLSSYITYNNNYNLLLDLIDKLNPNELPYLFSRLVFPFNYFEEVEQILLNSKNEQQLLEIINNIPKYEKNILEIEKIFNIYLFDWIKKSN